MMNVSETYKESCCYYCFHLNSLRYFVQNYSFFQQRKLTENSHWFHFDATFHQMSITLHHKEYSHGKMDDVDFDALASDLAFVSKSEKKEVMESLLKERVVFGMLPLGFGKMFYLFVSAKSSSSNSPNASIFRSKTNKIERVLTPL